MTCPVHNSANSGIANDSGYQPGTCTCYPQQAAESNKHAQYLTVYDRRLVSADESTQNNSDGVHWLPTDGEYSCDPEPIDYSHGGDSGEACRASDDTSSTDAQGFDTPTSSSDGFGAYYAYSRPSESSSDNVAVSWDENDSVGAGQDFDTYTMDTFLASDGPWSTYNRRNEPTQEPVLDNNNNNNSLNDDNDDRTIEPSYSG